MKKSSKGIMYAILAVLLWSTLGVGFKLAVTGLDSFTVTLMVGLFATIFLFFYLAIKKKLCKLLVLFKMNPLFFIVVGVIGLGIHPVLYIKGYSLLSASSTVVMFYTYPIWMILLSSLFFKDKLSLMSIVSVLIGFVGVVILITKGSLTGLSLNIGTILTLIAAFCWALFSVIIKYKKVDADIGMFLFNFFGLLFLCGMIPFFGINLPIGFNLVLGLIYLGVFPTAVAFLFWNKSLHLTNTSICSNLALLTPVLSIVLIYVILGDSLVLPHLIGLFIVLGSVLLSVNSKQQIIIQESINKSNIHRESRQVQINVLKKLNPIIILKLSFLYRLNF